MKRLLISALILCLIGIYGCSNILPSQQVTAEPEKPESYTIISDAVVMQLTTEVPRSLLLAQAGNQLEQVWFDETEDEIGFITKTLFYSVDGCPLPGPPILPGDPVTISAHKDEESRLVADIVWILNNQVGDENCAGPKAEIPELVVP